MTEPVGPDGAVYVFVLGEGLMLHLAIVPIVPTVPTMPDRLFAATGEGKLLQSSDRGVSWGGVAH